MKRVIITAGWMVVIGITTSIVKDCSKARKQKKVCKELLTAGIPA